MAELKSFAQRKGFRRTRQASLDLEVRALHPNPCDQRKYSAHYAEDAILQNPAPMQVAAQESKRPTASSGAGTGTSSTKSDPCAPTAIRCHPQNIRSRQRRRSPPDARSRATRVVHSLPSLVAFHCAERMLRQARSEDPSSETGHDRGSKIQ